MCEFGTLVHNSVHVSAAAVLGPCQMGLQVEMYDDTSLKGAQLSTFYPCCKGTMLITCTKDNH